MERPSRHVDIAAFRSSEAAAREFCESHGEFLAHHPILLLGDTCRLARVDFLSQPLSRENLHFEDSTLSFSNDSFFRLVWVPLPRYDRESDRADMSSPETLLRLYP